MSLTTRIFPIIALALAATGSRATAAEHFFAAPSDDQWQYWMNSAEGFRPTGSVFGAPGSAGLNADFNDRDGIVILAWDTTGLIAPGQGPQSYNVTRVRMTISAAAAPSLVPTWPVDLTLDEWFTYDFDSDGMVNSDGFPRGDINDTDGESSDADPGRPIELFGAGFGPLYSASTWTEFNLYEGAGQAQFGFNPMSPRDPFPFVFQDGTGELLHAEDNIRGLHNDTLAMPVTRFTPTPWAIGAPQGYTPGSQTTPFDVEFEVDLNLSAGAVKGYFQEQLNAGKVFLIVTSLKETGAFGSDPSGFPSFVLKEGLGLFPTAHAPQLRIEISNIPGDYDGDGDITPADFEEFPPCTTGAGGGIGDPDCSVFDFDTDSDVDLRDYAAFTLALEQ